MCKAMDVGGMAKHISKQFISKCLFKIWRIEILSFV